MLAEIITIGDEILIGQTVDTNSAWMSEALNRIGIAVIQITSIPDDAEAIATTLTDAGKRADLILITGGLGPTKDDITKITLAKFFGSKLVENREALKRIEGFLTSRGVEMNDLNIAQALLPDNCKALPNPYGTASGMWFTQNGRDYISMPGVPYEMKAIMTKSVLPELRKKHGLPHIIHRTILIQGIPESHLAKQLDDFERQLPGRVKLAYLPSPGMVKLRLTTSGDDKPELEKIIGDAIDKLSRIIPEDNLVGYEDEQLEKTVGEMLKKKNATLSTAESCTGGTIAQMMTSVSGSSEYFVGSVVAYSNAIKQNILGVSEKILETEGAVSEAVVREMATGVRKLYQTDYSIAVSGIAGPTGGTEDKPVGTTWIAVASDNHVWAEKFSFGDHRSRNIRKASLASLNLLRKLIMAEK
ncbi:MAG: competence/damage-inducible protein A [Bacteroidales bacterium]|nr:competence/damage-inducible protein A [Bacteroidales bacterium]